MTVLKLDPQLFAEWRAQNGGTSAASWLVYMGIPSSGALQLKHWHPNGGMVSAYSFTIALYLAEMMPEELAKWRALVRLGIIQ